MNDVKRYRYPGLSSFENSDQDVFFGRDDDKEYVLRSILLNSCTVICGKSGVGKSSLLNAGVLPEIRKTINQNEKNKLSFQVTRIRTGVWQQGDQITLVDRIRKTGNENSDENQFLLFLPDKIKETMWYKFKSLQFEGYRIGQKKNILIVIDQIEEVFTYPVDQFNKVLSELIQLQAQTLPQEIKLAIEEFELRDGFLGEDINEVLYSPIPVKFVIAIRSDKLSLIGRFKKAIPDIYKNVYELLPLSVLQAKHALISPSQEKSALFLSPCFNVEPVADLICNFLLNQPNFDLDYNFGDFKIEPFILQIICQHIERKIVLNTQKTEITPDDIFDLNEIIGNYYLESLKELQLSQELFDKMRKLIEEEMIYEPDKRRLSLFEEIICKKLGIGLLPMKKIFESKLFKELSYGSGAYELSHDCLVIPILNFKNARLIEENKLAEKLSLNSRQINKLDVIEEIENALKKNPYDYLQYKKLGDYYYSQQNYFKACDNYTAAIDIKQEPDTELYLSRSNCYFALERYEESNSDLQQIIAINEGDTYTNYCIGYNYHVMKDFGKALFYYKKTLAMDDSYIYANYNIGLIYKHQKQYKEASRFFVKVIEKSTTDYEAYFALIEIAVMEKDFELAIDYAQKAIAIDPELPENYNKVGNLFKTFDLADLALKYFRLATQKGFETASFHSDLGQVLLELGKIEEAIAEFRIAVQLDDKNTFYYTWLGFLYNNNKDYKLAIDAYQHALDLDPGYAYAWASLAGSHKRLGNEGAYQNFIKKAKSSKPKEWEDEYARACCQALCMNTDLAVGLLRTALNKKIRSIAFVASDIDFDFIRSEDKFVSLIEDYQNNGTVEQNSPE